jgi:predicted PurR-regulated permease PerM
MNQFPRWILIVAGICLGGFVFWYFSNIVICLLLAGVLSLVLKPIFEKIRELQIGKRQIPAALASLLSIIGVLILIAAVIAVLVPLITQQAKIISNINLNKVMNDLREPVAWLEKQLHYFNILPKDEQTLRIFVQTKITEVIQLLDISTLLQSVFETTGNIFLIVFSTLFILFFFLKEENLFLKIISLFIPDEKKNKLQNTFDNIRSMLFRYVLGIGLQVTCIMIYVTLLLHFMNIKNALLIGVLAGLFNIIPYLGPLIGLVVGIILAVIAQLNESGFTEMQPMLIKIIAVFASMQLLDNYVLQPFIFSKSTNSHPLEIFIVILAAGTFAGIMGMIVAVPVYTILRIIAFEFFSDTTFVQKIRREDI